MWPKGSEGKFNGTDLGVREGGKCRGGGVGGGGTWRGAAMGVSRGGAMKNLLPGTLHIMIMTYM